MIRKYTILSWCYNVMPLGFILKQTASRALRHRSWKWQLGLGEFFIIRVEFMFNSWLIQAQAYCILTAFWKNSLRRFFQGHCFGKKNRILPSPTHPCKSGDLRMWVAGGHTQSPLLTISPFAWPVPWQYPTSSYIYWFHGSILKCPHPTVKWGIVSGWRRIVAIWWRQSECKV